jgi:hypothetical protein
VDWTANGVPFFQDGRGVGPDWHAYLIVNLSVSDGTYHPAPPPRSRRLGWTCQSLSIERDAASEPGLADRP